MTTDGMAKLSLDGEKKIPHLPDEILVEIFSYNHVPPASKIARDRYEGLAIPQDSPVRDSPIKDYKDNDLHTGACTPEYGELEAKLLALSTIGKVRRNSHEVVALIIYAVYPGHTVIRPKLFISSLKKKPDLAPLVKQMIVDSCDSMNSPKIVQCSIEKIGLKQDFITVLDQNGREWNDEASAALLLLRCPDIEVLAFTLSSFYNNNTGILNLFIKLWRIDSVLRANKNVKSRSHHDRPATPQDEAIVHLPRPDRSRRPSPR